MNFIPVTSVDSPHFSPIWDIYQASFPLEERRPLKLQEWAFTKTQYELIAVETKGRVVGFISSWNLPHYCYVEHFAFSEDCRGNGLGTKSLNKYLSEKKVPVILEIEPLEDIITRRRCDFYQRLGFALTGHEHYQSPYRKGYEPLRLLIMSYGRAITEAEYQEFNREFREGPMSFSLE